MSRMTNHEPPFEGGQVECMYCLQIVTSGEVPDVYDDEAWERIAREHHPGCEWVNTRAHRRLFVEDVL